MKPAAIARDALSRLLAVQAVLGLWLGYRLYDRSMGIETFPWWTWGQLNGFVAGILLVHVAGLLLPRLFGLRLVTVTEYYNGPPEPTALRILKSVIWLAWFYICLKAVMVSYEWVVSDYAIVPPADWLNLFDWPILVLVLAVYVIFALGSGIFRRFRRPRKAKSSHLA